MQCSVHECLKVLLENYISETCYVFAGKVAAKSKWLNFLFNLFLLMLKGRKIVSSTPLRQIKSRVGLCYLVLRKDWMFSFVLSLLTEAELSESWSGK